MSRSVWIGFDPREAAAFAVARSSAEKFNRQIPIKGLVLENLRARGLYTRPTELRASGEHPVMIDVLSKRDDYDGAISTEFAISRFLVPLLAERGWALFMDCDVLVRANISEVFSIAEKFGNQNKAVICVKHDYRPSEAIKMDGQAQTKYSRKNWSSVVAFNCDHPANKALSLDMVNSLPGRDLHRFCWLNDDEIGELGPEWNFLVGHSDPKIDPKIVHFTSGGPWMRGYEDVPFAEEWRAELLRWVS